MPSPTLTVRAPRWRLLYEVAATQEGYFTTAQAAAVGYSRQLLAKHQAAGRIARVMRGVHRLVDFPVGEHEDLVIVWLWSGLVGVASHVTALFLHELSDALPSRAHVTVPEAWRRRRLRVPTGVILHFGDLDASQRTWVGAIPVTTVARTLVDCAAAHFPPDLVHQALRQAMHRGLIRPGAVPVVTAYLAPYFDIDPQPRPKPTAVRRTRRSR